MDLFGQTRPKRSRCEVDEDDQPRNGMESLPRDVALDILSRLPITSLLQFGFVCRSWYALSRDPHLVSLHMSRTARDTPSLIFHCDYPIRNQLCFVGFSDQDEREAVKRIHMPFSATMPEFHVVGSCNGLLCLFDSLYNDIIYIYNPFTGCCKSLPKSTVSKAQEEVLGFGFHSMTSEYKVVKLVHHRGRYGGIWRPRRHRTRDFSNSEVQVLTMGVGMGCNSTPTWRGIGKAPYQLERRCSEALINGRLHWVSRPGRYHGARGRIIVAFDLAEEQFREVPRPEWGGLNRCNYHLAVLGGCLSAAVYCSYGKLEIWVMKDYGVKESWVKQFNIGAYSPKLLDRELQQSNGIWRSILNGTGARILCLLKNGNILIEYKGGILVSYDPVSIKFKNLMFQGMPNLFQTVVHSGSLNWIDTPTGM